MNVVNFLKRILPTEGKTRIGFLFFIILYILTLSVYVVCLEIRPHISDEFSYILLADTLLQGRLTNPSPAFSEFFKALHTIVEPTYASKYMPGQGAALALGKLLFNEYILGSVLLFGLSCLACFWALGEYNLKKSQMLFTIWYAAHPLILTKLVFTYWGSIPCLLGGFLIYGSLIRMRRQKKSGFYLASIGFLLCFFTRPFEAILIALPISLYLWFQAEKKIDFLKLVFKYTAPLLTIGALFFFFYNYRITGNSLALPHSIYQHKYIQTPVFVTGHFQEKSYDNKQIEQWFDFQSQYYHNQTSSSQNMLLYLSGKVAKYSKFLFPNILVWVFVLFICRAVKKNNNMFLICASLFSLIVSSTLVTYFNFHYLAPCFPLLILLFAKLLDPFLISVKSYILISLLFLGSSIGAYFETAEIIIGAPESSCSSLAAMRNKVSNDLKRKDEKHLIFVDSKLRLVTTDIVHNLARIETQKIIWARDLGDKKNSALVKHYKQRKQWIIHEDASLCFKLSPYGS